jgi:transketolase
MTNEKTKHSKQKQETRNPMHKPTLAQQAINTIRTLAMDAVQAANSGHPGTPMAMAPVACNIWQNFLRFDPNGPIWSNRDPFVLSIGHASTLLYALWIIQHFPELFTCSPEIDLHF